VIVQTLPVREQQRAMTAIVEAQREQTKDVAQLALLQTQIDSERQRVRVSGDPTGYDAAVAKLDLARIEIQARMKTRDDKIKLLSDHLAEREAERKAKQYAASVEKVAGRILALNGAVAEFSDAIAAVMQRLEQFALAQRGALRDWPVSIERPLLSHIGLGRAEQTLAEAFKVFDRNVFSRWPDWSIEKKIDHVRSAAASFKADEVAGYDELIAELRASGPKESDEAMQ
jgi:hypothetical protein